jgi:arylsulfatase A-like enzyme
VVVSLIVVISAIATTMWVNTLIRKRTETRVIMLSLDTHAMALMSLASPDSQLDTNPGLRNLWQNDPNAVVFSNAMGVSHWTLPTHATVFTGLYPSQHGKYHGNKKGPFKPEHPTLHQILSSRGVATYHLVSHLRLDNSHGFAANTKHYASYTQPLGKRGRQLLTDAIRLLENNPDGDMFMFLHLFDAHSPYLNYPDRYGQYYKGPVPDGFPYYQDPRYKKYIQDGDRFPDSRQLSMEELKDSFAPKMPGSKVAYQLGLRDVDDMLAEFLDRLKEIGQYDNTTLILFSDHGEEFFEHGLLTHTSLYRQNIKVPFIIRIAPSPRSAKAQAITEPVKAVFEAHTTLHRIVLDLFQTPLSQAAIQAGTNAVALDDLLELRKDRPVFAEGYYPKGNPSSYETVWIENGYKLHSFTMIDSQENQSTPRQAKQLFNIDVTKSDHDDLCQVETALCEKQMEKLMAFSKRCYSKKSVMSDTSQLTEDDKKRLRALGYFHD